MLLRVLIFCLVFTTWSASAQDTPEDKDKSNWHIGVNVGPYLPSLITGVTEIMKTYGGRISYFDQMFGFEAWGFRSSEDGATVNYAGGSFVKGLKLPGISDVTVLVLGGLQTLYYHRAPENGRTYPYARGSGIHMGGGAMTQLKGNWSLRGGTMILNGPGRCAWVEIGVQYNF